jgi:hypothetical protein
VQVGAGLLGFGAGVSYHLKPRISSPFASLQYWRQVGRKESADILGAMYVYRYKKWLQAGAGLGTFLSESGAQKAGEALLMLQAGIFVPVRPASVKSKLAAALQATKSQEKEQEPSRFRQSVYFELLGRTQLYSVNYDCWFFTGHGGPGASVGVSYIDIFGVTALMVPVSVYYLVGGGNHHLELGVGATSLSFTGLMGTATVGYRYQSASGLMLRAGFTPLMYGVGKLFVATGGASVGYAF